MIKSKSLRTWQLIRKNLQQNVPIMLLYVLESHGSSPGRQGFLMAVNTLGEMEGSIGGGIMEHKFVEMAKERLRQADSEWSIRTQYHDKTAAFNQSGMICSGDQTILLYRMQSGDMPVVQAIITCLEQNTSGLLQLSPEGIRFSGNEVPTMAYRFDRHSEQPWVYQERLGYKHQLDIIGGGHCALALSRIMSQMDFYIRIFDDRPDLHTMHLNVFAHEKIVVNHYAELAELIPSGGDRFVVVMTFGYRTDDLAIRALMNNSLKFFGVLGSKTKIDKLVAEYRAEGISEELLARIHAPVGLPIHSQTPEEIAVSIAAQLIQVKNSVQT